MTRGTTQLSRPRAESTEPAPPSRIEQLAGLAAAARDKPTPGRIGRLSDMALVFGLAESGRLPLIVLAVIERIAETESTVLVELQSVVEAEQERRRRRERARG